MYYYAWSENNESSNKVQLLKDFFSHVTWAEKRLICQSNQGYFCE